MRRELVCIVCPGSCRLTVTDENGALAVSGHTCPRGEKYGLSEVQNPMRLLTSTVAIDGGLLARLPVVSGGEVPKAMLRECLQAVYALRVRAPVVCGQVLLANVCGTGVDVIAARSMEAAPKVPVALK